MEGNCYNLNPSDIIILRANELRRFSFGQGGLHERISVYISPSVISPVWNAGLPLLDIFKKHPLMDGGGQHGSKMIEDMNIVHFFGTK